MKIAIVGAGFAGVATAWHLTRYPNIQVTVFDPAGIGGGASGLAAGLLHPYAGAHAKLNWMGKEGMEATLRLIKPGCAVKTGLLRPALSEKQQSDFLKSSDNTWLTAEECQKLVPGIADKPGLFIPSAWTVDCKKHLEELWTECKGELKREAIHDLKELASFDAIVLTMGIASSPYVPLTPIKGQLLELEWPSDLPPLAFPLSSKSYIVMKPDNKSCIVGATFEKGFDSPLPDIKKALEELKPKYCSMIPALETAKVIDCKAAVRAGTSSHRPIIKQLDARTWIFAGLGSKGLLHHALLADELVHKHMGFGRKVEEEDNAR